MKEYVGLRAKTYCYLKDSNNGDKKQKAQKTVLSKENLNFNITKNCLKAPQIENKTSYLEKELNQCRQSSRIQ